MKQTHRLRWYLREGVRMRVRGRLAACAALGLIVGVIAFSSTGVAAKEGPGRYG